MEDRHQFVKYRNRMNYCIIFCFIESSTDADQTSQTHTQRPFYNPLCHLFTQESKDTTENAKPLKLVTCIFNINVCGISSQTHMTRHLGAQTHFEEVRQYRCFLRSGCRLASGDSTQQNAFRHPACFRGTFTSIRTSIYRHK